MSTTQLDRPVVHYEWRLTGAPDTHVTHKSPHWGDHSMLIRPTKIRVTIDGGTAIVVITGHNVDSSGRVARRFGDIAYQATGSDRTNPLDSLPEWARTFLAHTAEIHHT